MGIVFGKESKELFSSFFIPDPIKRRDALNQWIEVTTSVIQAEVEEELHSLIELITKDSWSENKWRPAARKLRRLQNTYQVALDIKLRLVNKTDKYIGSKTIPTIPKTEIDLHEKYAQEAIPLVDKFLQESYDACLENVRIIHGKGIGVLRQAIRDHLSNHQLVKSFKSADKDHGGEGATEAELVEFMVDNLN